MEHDLDSQFQEALDYAYQLPEGSLPPDVQLRLYAWYKRATHAAMEYRPAVSFDLRSAFKTNAWMQVSHISVEEAKQHYIDLVAEIKAKRT